MSDEPNQTETAQPAVAPISATSAETAAPAKPAQKSFDVALVDPHNPNLEHWPRTRVTVSAASLADLTDAQKAPPPGGESTEGEAKRLAFLVREIERGRAIAAYDAIFGLSTTANPMLRYDVVDAAGDAANLSKEWRDHLDHIRG